MKFVRKNRACQFYMTNDTMLEKEIEKMARSEKNTLMLVHRSSLELLKNGAKSANLPVTKYVDQLAQQDLLIKKLPSFLEEVASEVDKKHGVFEKAISDIFSSITAIAKLGDERAAEQSRHNESFARAIAGLADTIKSEHANRKQNEDDIRMLTASCVAMQKEITALADDSRSHKLTLDILSKHEIKRLEAAQGGK